MSERLLIVGPSWVGDMVVAQSLFKQCRSLKPNLAIDVIAPKWSRSLLDFMPEVDRVIPLQAEHGDLALGERRQLGLKLRKTHYQQAIVIPRSFKAALIPYWAKIPRRTGWLGEYRWGLLNDIRQLEPSKYPSLRERYSYLGLEVDEQARTEMVPEFKISTAQIQETQSKLNLDQSNKIVALCPGAEYGPAKRWSAQNFAELAILLNAQGIKPWILGSPKDQSIADEIQERCGDVCLNLTGKTTLKEGVSCLAMAAGVVCNDSGLMHIAAALKTPLIAIYGSSDPHYTPPLSVQSKIVSRQLSCSPCFERVCPLGHTACLEISALRVYQALAEYLE